MKYVVFGLGAVGRIIGSLITRSEEKEILIGKKNQVEEINKKDLKINDYIN